MKIRWAPEPAEHCFKAAEDFLTLVGPAWAAARIVKGLRSAHTTFHPAKDVLRAVGTDGNPLSALLPARNEHVRKATRRMRDRTADATSPVLLVVDTAKHNLIIADGDHRASAAYHLGENNLIACRLVHWGGSSVIW